MPKLMLLNPSMEVGKGELCLADVPRATLNVPADPNPISRCSSGRVCHNPARPLMFSETFVRQSQHGAGYFLSAPLVSAG